MLVLATLSASHQQREQSSQRSSKDLSLACWLHWTVGVEVLNVSHAVESCGLLNYTTHKEAVWGRIKGCISWDADKGAFSFASWRPEWANLPFWVCAHLKQVIWATDRDPVCWGLEGEWIWVCRGWVLSYWWYTDLCCRLECCLPVVWGLEPSQADLENIWTVVLLLPLHWGWWKSTSAVDPFASSRDWANRDFTTACRLYWDCICVHHPKDWVPTLANWRTMN